MVSLEEAVTARLDSGGHRFEILIDPEVAYAWKDNPLEDEELVEALAAEGIWKDAQKGDRAADTVLQEVFETDDLAAVSKAILEKGSLQLTTVQRRQMVEQKRNQLVNYIVRNAINPQTNTPHPPARIERALEEAKIHIDPFKSVEEQVKVALKKLKVLLPISIEKLRLAVQLPAQYVGGCHHEVSTAGNLVKEEYQSDGSWIGVLEITAGAYADLLNLLGNRTHGEAQTKILK